MPRRASISSAGVPPCSLGAGCAGLGMFFANSSAFCRPALGQNIRGAKRRKVSDSTARRRLGGARRPNGTQRYNRHAGFALVMGFGGGSFGFASLRISRFTAFAIREYSCGDEADGGGKRHVCTSSLAVRTRSLARERRRKGCLRATSPFLDAQGEGAEMHERSAARRRARTHQRLLALLAFRPQLVRL